MKPGGHRAKGIKFEQVIARDLKALWPGADVHRSSQAERARNPDVVIEGDAPPLAKLLWLELQDARQPTPLAKLAQATRDTTHPPTNRLPAVVWHRLGSPRCQATMRLWVLSDLTDNVVDWGHPHGGLVVTLDFEDFKRLLKALPMPKEAA